jgi:hypothetical protein
MKNMRQRRDRQQPRSGKPENQGVAKKRRRTNLMSAGAHRLAKPDKNLLRAVSKDLPQKPCLPGTTEDMKDFSGS